MNRDSGPWMDGYLINTLSTQSILDSADLKEMIWSVLDSDYYSIGN